MSGSPPAPLRVWRVADPSHPLELELLEPAARLRDGQVVGIPTETVYGLGASAYSDDAIRGVFLAKGRPSDNPLIVHVASMEMARSLCDGGKLPEAAEKLVARFWPGPLTVLVPTPPRRGHGDQGADARAVSALATAGLPTVGLRMPEHPVALALIRLAGVPVAAPSANISGRPSPTDAAHVASDLAGREVAGVVDGGPARVGLESTVVDCTLGPDRVAVLRPGGVTAEQLREVIARVDADAASESGAGGAETAAPRAPGMKYAHYAPQAPLVLVDGDAGFFISCVVAQRGGPPQPLRRVGVLVPEEMVPAVAAAGVERVEVCGSLADIGTVARALFSSLRRFDSGEPVDVILAPCFPRDGVGEAVMNRLTKASAGNILRQGDLARGDSTDPSDQANCRAILR